MWFFRVCEFACWKIKICHVLVGEYVNHAQRNMDDYEMNVWNARCREREREIKWLIYSPTALWACCRHGAC